MVDFDAFMVGTSRFGDMSSAKALRLLEGSPAIPFGSASSSSSVAAMMNSEEPERPDSSTWKSL